jgi:integrase
VGEMLTARRKNRVFALVFANGKGKQYLGTSINHLHREVAAPEIDGKRRPIFGSDFVLHSLRHTMLTRLGESGVDAFTIMRIAGHSSVVVSQRYVHPTPEAIERAFERLQLHASASMRSKQVALESLQFSLQSGKRLL